MNFMSDSNWLFFVFTNLVLVNKIHFKKSKKKLFELKVPAGALANSSENGTESI